ncbi:MAG TPA: hypothetical protein VMQ44_02350 [Candidatus Saccharimonadales bacterium]|nr:hypothetical protein [Candidatus Saccharimonadales bacterium]
MMGYLLISVSLLTSLFAAQLFSEKNRINTPLIFMSDTAKLLLYLLGSTLLVSGGYLVWRQEGVRALVIILALYCLLFPWRKGK